MHAQEIISRERISYTILILHILEAKNMCHKSEQTESKCSPKPNNGPNNGPHIQAFSEAQKGMR